MTYAKITRTDNCIQYFRVLDRAKMELVNVGGGFSMSPNMDTVKAIKKRIADLKTYIRNRVPLEKRMDLLANF